MSNSQKTASSRCHPCDTLSRKIKRKAKKLPQSPCTQFTQDDFERTMEDIFHRPNKLKGFEICQTPYRCKTLYKLSVGGKSGSCKKKKEQGERETLVEIEVKPMKVPADWGKKTKQIQVSERLIDEATSKPKK